MTVCAAGTVIVFQPRDTTAQYVEATTLTDIEVVLSFSGWIECRPERRAKHPLAPALQVCNREAFHA